MAETVQQLVCPKCEIDVSVDAKHCSICGFEFIGGREGSGPISFSKPEAVSAFEEPEMEEYELAFEGLVVNKLSRTVRIDNELVDFRPKEFDLLVFLIENHRIALDRDRILDAVWGIDYFGDTRVVDTHIKKIRKKLAAYSKYIHTVFGVGYKFEVN